jgi:hypothetical protein
MVPSAFQGFLHVLQMCVMIQGLDHDIINVNFNNFADQLVKDVIHGSLIGCTGILQPKCHDYPFKQAYMTRTSEGCL